MPSPALILPAVALDKEVRGLPGVSASRWMGQVLSSTNDSPPQRATSQGVSLAFRILMAAFPIAKSALRGPTLDHVAGVFFWGHSLKFPLYSMIVYFGGVLMRGHQ